ncbi:MAG: BamA/TamA family outer membrane protein [bacterium]
MTKVKGMKMHRVILFSLIILCIVPLTAQADDDLVGVSGIIEKIEIRGSTKIREKFIRREITIKVGEKFNLEKAIESKNKILLNLKYIKRVNLYIEPGSEEGKLIVIFEIEETESKSLTLGVGYGDEEKFFGSFQVWYENLLHRGMHLGIKVEKGKNVDFKSVTIYEPRLFHTTHSFKSEFYSDEHKRTEFPYEDKGKYWIERDGYMLELGKRAIFKNINFWLKYRNENVNLSEFKEVSQQEINSSKKDTDINSLICHLDFDTRQFQHAQAKYEFTFKDKLEHLDDTQWLNPVNGGRYELFVEVVNDFLGADYSFTKYNLNLNQYLKLNNDQVLALFTKGGYICGDAPFYERFYVGGVDTIRGYKERGITTTAGNKLLVLTTEYRIGLTKFAQGVLFADAGYSWEKGNRINLGNMEYGVGTGLRIYHSLIGRININLGYGLGKKDWEIHIGSANRGE